jgi:hypothetical protein
MTFSRSHYGIPKKKKKTPLNSNSTQSGQGHHEGQPPGGGRRALPRRHQRADGGRVRLAGRRRRPVRSGARDGEVPSALGRVLRRRRAVRCAAEGRGGRRGERRDRWVVGSGFFGGGVVSTTTKNAKPLREKKLTSFILFFLRTIKKKKKNISIHQGPVPRTGPQTGATPPWP